MFEDVSVLLHAQDQATAPVGQELVHVNVSFESRPGCLEISAQQEATTRGRVVLCRQLTLVSRPEERVKQIKSGEVGGWKMTFPRVSDRFSSYHALTSGTCMRGSVVQEAKKVNSLAFLGSRAVPSRQATRSCRFCTREARFEENPMVPHAC